MEKEAIRVALINRKGTIIGSVLGLVGVIGGAVIINLFSGSKTPSTRPVNAGRDNINAGHDVTVNNNVTIGDTTKHKGQGNGNITVNSYNQRGGITAANVEIKHTTIIQQVLAAEKADSPSHYKIAWDSANRVIRVQPEKGVWEKPFVGFPNDEKDAVNPKVQIQNQQTITTNSAVYSIDSCRLFGVQSFTAATSVQYYSIHYDTLPSYVIFGNYPSGPLFRLSLPNRSY